MTFWTHSAGQDILWSHSERGLWLSTSCLTNFPRDSFHPSLPSVKCWQLCGPPLPCFSRFIQVHWLPHWSRFLTFHPSCLRLKTTDDFTFSLEEIFVMEFSHYTCSTGPTKKLDWISCTSSKMSLTRLRLFQNLRVLMSLIVVVVLSIVCIRTTYDAKTQILRLCVTPVLVSLYWLNSRSLNVLKEGWDRVTQNWVPTILYVCGMYVGCMCVVCNHALGPSLLGAPDPRCTSFFVSRVNILIPSPPSPLTVWRSVP